jgi:hypothetical protein
MKQTTRGERQAASVPKPMTIVLQPGQVLTIVAADSSGVVSRSALDMLAAVTSSFPDSIISPSKDPDSSISPSASKDRSGRI